MIQTRSSPRESYVDYEPKGAAQTLFTSQEPEIVLSGPAGTGKSRGVLEKLHLCLLKYPGAKALALRKTQASLTATGVATYREKVRPHLDGVKYFGGSGDRPPAFLYPNTARLELGGLDTAEAIQKVMSGDYDLIYVQELIDISEAHWESLTTRLRNGMMPYQQMLADTNPSASHHWVKQRSDRGALLMLESRHEDNPRLWDGKGWTAEGRAYIAKLDALTGVRLQRLRYGRWAAAEGLVYDAYDRATHLISEGALPSMRSHIAAVDWGFTNAGVITVWGIDGDGRAYLVHEVYQSRKLIDWWVGQGKRINQEYDPTLFACDPSEPAYIADFQRAGLPAVSATNAIGPGIRAVQQRLQIAPDGRSRLFVVRDALVARDEELASAGKPHSTDQEYDSYVWPKGVDGKPLKEVPVDEDNHGLDTVRYAVMALDGGSTFRAEDISSALTESLKPDEELFT